VAYYGVSHSELKNQKTNVRSPKGIVHPKTKIHLLTYTSSQTCNMLSIVSVFKGRTVGQQEPCV